MLKRLSHKVTYYFDVVGGVCGLVFLCLRKCANHHQTMKNWQRCLFPAEIITVLTVSETSCNKALTEYTAHLVLLYNKLPPTTTTTTVNYDSEHQFLTQVKH